jgi:hypothetical protein
MTGKEDRLYKLLDSVSLGFVLVALVLGIIGYAILGG